MAAILGGHREPVNQQHGRCYRPAILSVRTWPVDGYTGIGSAAALRRQAHLVRRLLPFGSRESQAAGRMDLQGPDVRIGCTLTA